MLSKGRSLSARLSPCLTSKCARESLRTTYTKSHVTKDKTEAFQHPQLNIDEINSVSELLNQATEIYAHKDLFRQVEQGDRFTYIEVKRHTNALSNGLYSGRIGPKKTLPVSLLNVSENLMTRLAATQMGVHIAHMDISSLTPDLIKERFDVLQPRSLITDPKYRNTNIIEIYEEALPEIPAHFVVASPYPLKIRRYRDFKLAIQTTREEFLPGWDSFKDVLLYDPLPDPLGGLIKQVKATQIIETHFSRFHKTPNNTNPSNHSTNHAHAYQFTMQSIVQSALQFGRVSNALRGKRVGFAVDFSSPEVHSVALACIAFGSYMVVPSSWYRESIFLDELHKERVETLVISAGRLKELLESPGLDTERLFLESALILNSPNEIADSELISRAKSTLQLQTIEVCLISDGCVAPFLHTEIFDPSQISSSLGGKILGGIVPNGSARVIDQNGNDTPIGVSGRLFTKGEHVFSEKIRIISNNEKSIENEKENKKEKENEKEGWIDCGINVTMDSNGNFFLANQ